MGKIYKENDLSILEVYKLSAKLARPLNGKKK